MTRTSLDGPGISQAMPTRLRERITRALVRASRLPKRLRLSMLSCGWDSSRVRWVGRKSRSGKKARGSTMRPCVAGSWRFQEAAPGSGRIRAALWLQGEADATDERLPVYEAKVLKLIDDLRADFAWPQLPFIACTIGEMRPDEGGRRNAGMNRVLFSLPEKRPGTACVDARDLKDSIGDQVHFDTAAQNEIGRRFAAKYFALTR